MAKPSPLVTIEADQPPRQTLPPTKQYFAALDGLRGVAALVVVVFHFMEMVMGDYSKLFIGNGWLAVDFFFCLSGFVIGHAYDNRIQQIGLWNFLKVRLVRLHPLVVFGSVLGLLTLLVDPFRAGPLGYKAGQVALMFVTSIFLIPYPIMQERGHSLFSLNSPAWSLFWEYVANIIYAVVLYRFSRRWLSVATICAAIILCLVGHSAGYLGRSSTAGPSGLAVLASPSPSWRVCCCTGPDGPSFPGSASSG